MTAWLLNVVLFGTGLIIKRREWLGFCLAMLFGICGNVAMAGWLIAPAAIPSWLSWLALGVAGVAWLLSQLLLRRQGIFLKRRAGALAELLREARAALEAGDIDRGRLALESGTAMDDESVEAFVLMARLCASQGDGGGMRRAWRRALELDRSAKYRAEARQALKGE